MVADQLDYVVGVDPHRDEHAIGVVDVRSGAAINARNASRSPLLRGSAGRS